MNIYETLNSKYGTTWSICNSNTAVCEPEGKLTCFIDLVVDGRSTIGAASIDIDYSSDVTERVLEKAVISAYKKMKIMKRVG